MIIDERIVITPNLSYKNTIVGVSMKWENDYEVDKFFRYVLIRNKLRIPRSHFDGVEVYRGKENSFVDKTVKNGETYYYSLYFVIGYAKKAKQPTYVTNKNCNFRITALLEGNDANLIYNNLPRMYRRYDNLISKSDVFNKPLYRMCRVFGYEFDKLETHVDRIYDVIDIDKCPDVMLPTLMRALGVEYDWNISSKENRMLTKIKTLAYSKRGTITGLRLVLTNLLKSKIDIIVPKTKVKYTDGIEAIEKKRTITIIANNFQSDFIWVEENYEKFLEVINEFLPKKLNVKLVLIGNFFDDYIKERMSDDYDVEDGHILVFNEVSKSIAIDSLEHSTLIGELSDMPYSKHIGEISVSRLSEVPRKVDVYLAQMSDNVDIVDEYTDRKHNSSIDEYNDMSLFNDKFTDNISDNFANELYSESYKPNITDTFTDIINKESEEN